MLGTAGSVAATETYSLSEKYEGVMAAFKPAPAPSVSLLQSDPTPSATGVQDLFTVSGVTITTIKCIQVSFLTTLAGGGVKPTGMNVGSATLDSSSTWPASPASWAPTDDNAAGTVTLTDASGTTPASNSSRALELDGITNPSSTGTYYATIASYTSATCTTGQVDSFVVASSINGATTVSVTIDPAFTFTVANQSSACNGESNFLTGAGGPSTVALGQIAAGANVSGGQALSVTGNSGGGFSVYVRGTQATQDLRSVVHNWADVAGTYASPAPLGAGERFGYTYEDSTVASSVTNPASANFIALTNAATNAVMGSTTSEVGSGCVSYDAQASASTPASSYTATIVYTAVPNF